MENYDQTQEQIVGPLDSKPVPNPAFTASVLPGGTGKTALLLGLREFCC